MFGPGGHHKFQFWPSKGKSFDIPDLDYFVRERNIGEKVDISTDNNSQQNTLDG